jgi:hypothetical protein
MAVSPDDIAAALAAFDGRHVAPLRVCVGDAFSAAAMQALLIALPGPHQIGASWMLKALAETGRLSDADLRATLQQLPALHEPDAILHVLQTVQYAPASDARALRDHLRPLYRHTRGMVRVWAFDAYCRGADLPAERADIAARIDAALTDRQAAMRARGRGLARHFGGFFDPKS